MKKLLLLICLTSLHSNSQELKEKKYLIVTYEVVNKKKSA